MRSTWIPFILTCSMAYTPCAASAADSAATAVLTAQIDPITRYIQIGYPVPPTAPDEVTVLCTWSAPGANDWKAAKVTPLLSETGFALAHADEWNMWLQGRLAERRAAGLKRTVVFNPYPETQVNGRVDVDFRIQLQTSDGRPVAEYVQRAQADNSDVVYIEDWSQPFTTGEVVTGEAPPGKWSWKTGLGPDEHVTLENALSGQSDGVHPLTPLSYPLDVDGRCVLFACTAPDKGSIRLRLSGDERSDTIGSRFASEEVLWRWAPMDRQHLVLSQPHQYTGYVPAQVDYIKLVPLPDAVCADLDSLYAAKPDKFIGGYYEPYSWAFYEDVRGTLQHREPLAAFVQARIALVDIQLGRFGDKVVYESRLTDQLLHSTIGDPIGSVAQPTTDNVGRMQQYTNTLDACLRYAREMGLRAHANFGASNCYPGTPLQSDFSKQHQDWMRGSALRYEVPEVREYALSLYREALELGAPGVSLDFCRYPETIDATETANLFMKALHALVQEFATKRGTPVPVLVRFPGTGVRNYAMFDHATWAREGWVDFLCPSNLQGRHMNIDMTPYIDAVRGTPCTLLPCLDGLEWGLPFPGPFLWRVKQLYDQGVSGLYIYQADGRVLGTPGDRRTMSLLCSSESIRRWWDADSEARTRRSKRIVISAPEEFGVYHGWERIRIWVDGVPLGPLEAYVDDKLVTQVAGPPYLVGTEDNASDGVIASGEHKLRIRVKDRDGWLEEMFPIKGA